MAIVSSTLQIKLTTIEELATNVPAALAKNRRVTHDGFNKETIFTPTSSPGPDGEEVVYTTLTLSGGAYTLDLTALTQTNGKAYDATGKKVRAIVLDNPSGNATMAFAPGGSNPYNLWGSSSFAFALFGGAYKGESFADSAPTVASNAKTIAITGTGTQSLNVGILFG